MAAKIGGSNEREVGHIPTRILGMCLLCLLVGLGLLARQENR